MKIEMTVWDAAFMRTVCYGAPARHEEIKEARKLRCRLEREPAAYYEEAQVEIMDGGRFRINGDPNIPVEIDMTVGELSLVDGLARRIVWDPKANSAALIDRAYDFVEDSLAGWMEEAKADEMYQTLPASQKAALRKRAKRDENEK